MTDSQSQQADDNADQQRQIAADADRDAAAAHNAAADEEEN